MSSTTSSISSDSEDLSSFTEEEEIVDTSSAPEVLEMNDLSHSKDLEENDDDAISKWLLKKIKRYQRWMCCCNKIFAVLVLI